MRTRHVVSEERREAYRAINSERAYQDYHMENDDRPDMHALTPGEMILAMEHCLEGAKYQWYKGVHPHTEAAEYVRKVAGLAVQFMEQYGAPQREGFEQ